MSTNPLVFLWSDDSATTTTPQLPTTNRERRNEYTEEEIKEKIAYCRASWKSFYEPNNGKRQTKPFLCRIFHSEYGHCPHCLEQRTFSITKRVVESMTDAHKVNEQVYYEDVDISERGNYARKYGKDNYIACPISEDVIRVFYQAPQPGNQQAKEVSTSMPMSFWKETAMSPVGKNMSGNMGKLKSTPDVEPSEATEINVTEVVITGLTRQEEESANKEALLETIDMQPITPEEVEECLQKRIQAFMRAVVRRGGAVKYVEVIKHKLCASDIKWATGKELLESEIDSDDIFSLVDW